MSYTSLFKVPEKGEICYAGEFSNAFRGAWMVWEQMGKHYIGADVPMLMVRNKMQDVWDLFKNPSVPLNDRIVMMSTFDSVMVRRENIPRLIEAIEDYATRFDPGHLLDQVRVLRKLANDLSCIAVCWSQTSVVADAWMVPDILECGHSEDWRYYDISKDEGHWFLFSEILTEASENGFR